MVASQGSEELSITTHGKFIIVDDRCPIEIYRQPDEWNGRDLDRSRAGRRLPHLLVWMRIIRRAVHKSLARR